jgi:diaminopimelate decarboxylase
MSQLLNLFPPGSATDADGMLIIGGCRVDDLAAEFGTPVLVVAEEALRNRAREYAAELTSRWANSRVVFASKAFPCTAVQRVMVQEGLGLDVAGGGEILTALKAGVDPALIVLHGNAKTTEEITMAVENGIGLVVVDGPDDVDRLEAIVPAGKTQDVLVRIIPGVTADTHAHVLTGHEGSKFEPGRSIVATMAATIYRVVTVKRGQTTFVAVDGGMGDNLEVALFDQRFEAGIANRLDAAEGEIVTAVGRHCESGDILVDDVQLNAPRVDDLLAVPATGAYCYTMSNNYNGNRRIPVAFVASGTPSLVVRRETWDDLAARDVS